MDRRKSWDRKSRSRSRSRGRSRDRNGDNRDKFPKAKVTIGGPREKDSRPDPRKKKDGFIYFILFYLNFLNFLNFFEFF